MIKIEYYVRDWNEKIVRVSNCNLGHYLFTYPMLILKEASLVAQRTQLDFNK